MREMGTSRRHKMYSEPRADEVLAESGIEIRNSLRATSHH